VRVTNVRGCDWCASCTAHTHWWEGAAKLTIVIACMEANCSATPPRQCLTHLGGGGGTVTNKHSGGGAGGGHSNNTRVSS